MGWTELDSAKDRWAAGRPPRWMALTRGGVNQVRHNVPAGSKEVWDDQAPRYFGA